MFQGRYISINRQFVIICEEYISSLEEVTVPDVRLPCLLEECSLANAETKQNYFVRVSNPFKIQNFALSGSTIG